MGVASEEQVSVCFGCRVALRDPSRRNQGTLRQMTAIRPARSDELHALRTIESTAGRMFATVAMPEIAAAELPTIEELDSYRSRGCIWVAVDAEDHPVAYLTSGVVDGCAHIHQVSVTTSHAHRRLGAALIEHLATIATEGGRPALTLTTFRDVPWNAPYYARLGFVVMQAGEYGPQLRSLVAREAVTIPGDTPRVAMRRNL